MAVDFSCLQKELLGYVPFGFTQTRNFIIEKAKSVPPLACQPNVLNTQGKLDHLNNNEIVGHGHDTRCPGKLTVFLFYY